jgi:hypothetical protein
LLDTQGTPVIQHPVASSNWGCRIWTGDVDRDGADELVLDGRDGIVCLRPSKLDDPVWKIETENAERRSDPRDAPRLIGVHRSADSQAIVLLRRHGAGDNSLEGIDIRNGKQLWRCQGPTPQSQYGPLRVDTLMPLSQQALPVVFFHHGDVALTRRATRAGGTIPASSVLMVENVPSSPEAVDPRLLRQLPWQSSVEDLLETARRFRIVGSLYAMTLLLLPCGVVIGCIRRKRWSLRTMALLPVVIGLFIVALGVDGPEAIKLNTMQKFYLGFAFLPLIPLVVSFTAWALTRRWKTLAYWAASVAVISFLVASYSLLVAAAEGGDPLPGERYSWDGWYLVGVLGLYLTGWGILFSFPSTLRAFAKSVRSALYQAQGQAA